MNVPSRPQIVKSSALQSYQTILYSRALHPELFDLKGRTVVRHNEYELEAWVMEGAHLLRFEHDDLCACELVTPQESGIPDASVVSAFYCAGERDYEHLFPRQRVNYMTTVTTETLSDNLYAATLQEMRDHARETDALHLHWDADGESLSLIDIQRLCKEVHIQAYHLLAQGGLVLRSQTIFELR
ncbi:MAG: hypothetical protein KDA28_08920 [Phycisphaerales bacterium]|nr:hypothetical protein [Phycisphaerales bacterium]